MSRRILLVDDEPDTLRMYSELLRAEQYEVCAVSSGEEALALVDRVKPDAILLDIILPGKSGVEVARELSTRSETRPIPIAVITALTSFPEKSELETLPGVRRFIYKPCRPRTFLAVVDDLFRYGPALPPGKIPVGPGNTPRPEKT